MDLSFAVKNKLDVPSFNLVIIRLQKKTQKRQNLALKLLFQRV